MAACVTRILELRGFSSSLKTRDIHAAFADFGESIKIKWIDDNSLYLVLADAVTAKRLFLQTLGSMPAQLIPAPNSVVTLTPYKGLDGQAIIAFTQRPSKHEARNSSIASQDASMALATGNISPAVSMMILAAAAAGPPGHPANLNGITGHSALQNGVHYPPIHQMQPGALVQQRRGSNPSLRSSFSQGENLGHGFTQSGSGNAINVAAGMQPPGNGPAWSDTANYYYNGNQQPSASSSGLQMLRPTLEGIAEATSKEEHSPNSSYRGPTTAATNIVVTASTPIVNGEMDQLQYIPGAGAGTFASGMSSPLAGGQTKSDTNHPGGPWLSREPSPTPSLPSLHRQPSLNSLIRGLGDLRINAGLATDEASSEGERSVDGIHGIRTPPEGANARSTPPRIGNPGKRMLGHALGIRHPSLPPRVIAGATSAGN